MKTFGYICLGILAIVVLWGLGVAGEYMYAAHQVATAPARVIQRTYTTENMMNAYHTFRDDLLAYQSRTAQIYAKQKTMTQKGIDQDEINRRQIELEGQQQSCRDIVAQYNANSLKVDQNMFKDPIFISNHMPQRLDMTKCDTGENPALQVAPGDM